MTHISVEKNYRCPGCGGKYYGSTNFPEEGLIYYCHGGDGLPPCGWSGAAEECFTLPSAERLLDLLDQLPDRGSVDFELISDIVSEVREIRPLLEELV